MPIVDGLTSTKMIRSFEKSNPSHNLSPRALLNGRVPIIAVSASLLEENRQTYIDSGFDGWILKPISFSRLSEIMTGIVDEDVRRGNLYKLGRWELGGWFDEAQKDVFAANTQPSGNPPSSGASKTATAVSAIDDPYHKDDAESEQTLEQQQPFGEQEDKRIRPTSQATSMPELGSKEYNEPDISSDSQPTVMQALVSGGERHSSPAPMTPEATSEN